MAAPEKRCLYEVLGLPTDCSPEEIRSAYKRLALQRHPDKLIKSGLSPDAATASFQELSNAYEVLSDPRERAWYDSHRSQILFSNPSSSSSSHVPDLFSLFSNSAFSGFSDSPKGFYKVYSNAFDRIYANELNFARKLGLGSVKEAPVMGNLDSPYSQVRAFYDYWLGFVTVLDFCWVDQYDAMAGVNRKSRRVMEEENKKLRKKARREYNETVRGLAEFVKKRDKRVIDMMVKKEAEMERRKEEERERRRQKERERAEQARAYEEPEWARVDEELDSRGVEDDDDDDGVKTKREGQEFYCVVCGKKFKSDKQWKNHEQSKKHKEKVLALRESLMEDGEIGEEEEDEEGDDGFGTNLNENGDEFDPLEHTEDMVDELGDRFNNNIRLEEGEGEGEKSEGEVSFSGNETADVHEKVDGMRRVGESIGSDAENSVLEAMLSGHRSRKKEASKHQTKSSHTTREEFSSDSVGFMEYDNRKRRQRKNGGKRGKGNGLDAESGRADSPDIGRPANENSRRMEDLTIPSLEKHDADDQGYVQEERNRKGSSQRADRKIAVNHETNTKSKNSSKGKKQKATTKKSSNSCDACGEDFESRNKLHKHLGETGHASLKSR